MREQAEEVILAQIMDGTLLPGTQVPTIRDFSAQLGISFRTVQQALAGLQAKGYVSMRQGAGTFVTSAKPGLTLTDAVVLCMETRAHVFGELAGLLTRRLQGQGRMPSVVDISQTGWDDVLVQAARSEAQVFVVYGGPHFAYGVLHQPIFERKRLIGVLDWFDDGLAGRMPLALVDHRLGGVQVAQHLAAAGHERILLAGSDNTLATPCRQAAGFREAWKGALATVVIRYGRDDTAELDVRAAVALFQGPNAPTAVFGMRDYDVICLQRALAGQGIDLAAVSELVGYGNTPWSHGGTRGFSTVDWNLETIAMETCRFIAETGTKDPPVRHVAVAPRLVLREASGAPQPRRDPGA